MILAYLAHPLTAPTRAGIDRNRDLAARWAVWLRRNFNVLISADWIYLTGVLEETPENRALGLAADIEHVKRCDLLIAVGERFSEGMKLEASHAKAVLDLTPPCQSANFAPWEEGPQRVWWRETVALHGAKYGLVPR